MTISRFLPLKESPRYDLERSKKVHKYLLKLTYESIVFSLAINSRAVVMLSDTLLSNGSVTSLSPLPDVLLLSTLSRDSAAVLLAALLLLLLFASLAVLFCVAAEDRCPKKCAFGDEGVHSRESLSLQYITTKYEQSE